jgi:hypothetical protein
MATTKQKEAIKEIVEKRGSISGAMREVGYAENTAKNPKNLTESKAYKEIFGNVVTEDELANLHREKLYSEQDMVGLKALDMAYKVNGSYAPEKSVSLTANLDIESDNPKMKEFKKQTIEKLREIYES